MPNTGKPSKDCHECRKRRVKCDLGRPECQRCLKIGKRCPGYRDESSLLFRNEDATSLAGPSATRDRRRPQANETYDSIPSGPSTPPLAEGAEPNPNPVGRQVRMTELRAMDELIFAKGWRSPPSRTLLDHWSQYAVPIVLSMFSAEVAGRRHYGRMAFLPQMLLHCPDDSPLILCCQALAFAYLANKAGSSEAEGVRDEIYGQALAATNRLVGDSDSAKEDETSVSVWLLSIYEIIYGSHISTPASGHITWSIHVQGLVGLLRIRGPDQMQTEQGRNIFWLLSSSTQIQSLVAGVECPDFIESWLEDFQTQNPHIDTNLIELSKFAKTTARVAAGIRDRLNTTTSVTEPWTIDGVWNEVQNIEIILKQALYRHTLEDAVILDNIFFANQYRVYFVRMLQYVLDFISSDQVQQNPSTDHERLNFILAHITANIQTLATATLQNATHILGTGIADPTTQQTFMPSSSALDRPVEWSDILILLWPLRITAARPHILRQQQYEFAQACLHCISMTYCIRHAHAPFLLLTQSRSPH